MLVDASVESSRAFSQSLRHLKEPSNVTMVEKVYVTYNEVFFGSRTSLRVMFRANPQAGPQIMSSFSRSNPQRIQAQPHDSYRWRWLRSCKNSEV